MLNCIRPLTEVSKVFLIQPREFEKHKMAKEHSSLGQRCPFESPASDGRRCGAGAFSDRPGPGFRRRQACKEPGALAVGTVDAITCVSTRLQPIIMEPLTSDHLSPRREVFCQAPAYAVGNGFGEVSP
jgi:hypothetical protein